MGTEPPEWNDLHAAVAVYDVIRALSRQDGWELFIQVLRENQRQAAEEAKAMYTPSGVEAHKIEHNFSDHSPKEDQLPRFETLRAQARALAGTFATLCPASRELSLALTNLEQAVMWANAAIARNE